MNEIKLEIPIGYIHEIHNPDGTFSAEGYMLCDGEELSRIEYKELFDVIGTNYGNGDGSTTFNLPLFMTDDSEKLQPWIKVKHSE